ncbi:MAG: aminotransferase class I/II-fold pyridoxal phosphate-dependent enzyme [Clostridiales bacterium]|nr:aminotransferase class I/II-fold pyridoxal phosphate-dependent enzyme [Candidatus Coliplasma caballi]
MLDYNALLAQYETIKAKGKKLDMSRGKPSPEQLGTMSRILTVVTHNDQCFSETGTDCRNYGGLEGINEMRRLFGNLMGVSMEQVIVGGNSSLNMMFDVLARAMLHGVKEGCKPWCKYDQISFLCPVPGYDRHFAMCEFFGINMINVPLLKDGPDMDLVEKLVSEDETIKGIWCVPKYANPTGTTYSDEVVRRFAQLKPAAKDFRVFWDNAYIVHDLTDTPDQLLNIFEEAEKYGNDDLFLEFMSTSKISYSGAGISCMASSRNNINRILQEMKFQTIGHDKLNQLRHSKVFRTVDDVKAQMQVHRSIIAPKFYLLYRVFEEELGPLENVQWTKPNGGYFICMTLPNGTAKRVEELAAGAGLVLTKAGAPFPYGKDPNDNVLRIAPTYPSLNELAEAAPLLCCCIKLAICEREQIAQK